MDDGNFKLPAIGEGLVWDKDSRSLKMGPPSSVSLDPPDKRTALIIKDIADSISRMLRFTADFPSAHSNGRLPILDIETWCSESPQGTVTNYSFYMKPMANPVTIPSSSAISNAVKFNTYREETKRVLRNTSQHLPWSHKANLLTDLSCRMKLSGYNGGFRSKVIAEGLRGHMKKVVKSFQDGSSFNRSGEEIRSLKSARRRTDRDWFRKDAKQYNSVLFVPATANSELAKTLRYHEEQNLQGRSSRFKIVEKAGKSLKQILSRSYPWPTQKCSDLECFPCTTGSKMLFSCRIPSAGYCIYCTMCESAGSPAIYYGETGQNLYTRGAQHKDEFGRKLSTNCMVIHNERYHPEDLSSFHFRMEGTNLFSTAMDRQIDESVRIENSAASVVMNSGSEWRMDPIPRARVAKKTRP